MICLLIFSHKYICQADGTSLPIVKVFGKPYFQKETLKICPKFQILSIKSDIFWNLLQFESILVVFIYF